MHFLAALRAFDGDLVDVRTMQLDIIRAVVRHGLEFLDGADRMLMAALALPHRQRRAPVAVTGDPPVLQMFEPVTETALAYGLWNPVDCVIIRNEFLFDIRHLDEPGLACIVDQRRIAAPAMRVAVLELRCPEQFARFLEIIKDQRVSILDEYASPVCIFRQLAFRIDILDERHVILAADPVIVFAESRSSMDNTSTIGRRNIAVAHDIKCLFLELANSIVIERLIFLVLKILALHLCQYLAFAFRIGKNRIHQSFRQIVYRTVHINPDIVNFRIHDKSKIRRQRPWCRRPGKEISILIFDLELDHCRALFDVLIALCNLM